MADNRLTITIDAKNLSRDEFKQLQTDAQKSATALQAQAKAAKGLGDTSDELRDSQGRLRDEQGKYLKETSKVKAVTNNLRAEYQGLKNDIGNVTLVTGALAAGTALLVKGQIESALQFEQLRKSLEVISTSSGEANAQFERLVQVARLPGLNLNEAIRASVQLQAIGTSGEDAAKQIEQFGNALALGGGNAQQLGEVVNAIRQMSAEGKILQEDLAIMTTRVATLTPILKETFGGTRAEDVRNYYESIGKADQQAELFLQTMTQALTELPRAGETAANAIENLSDTFERTQSSIGTHFLPVITEATGLAEKFFSAIEKSEGASKTVAVVETLGGTFLGLTAGATGLITILPRLTAAMTFLFTNPIGIGITAVAALVAGFVAWKIATQEVENAHKKFEETIKSTTKAIASGNKGAIQEALDKNREQQQLTVKQIESSDRRIKQLQSEFKNHNRLNDNRRLINKELAKEIKNNESLRGTVDALLKSTEDLSIAQLDVQKKTSVSTKVRLKLTTDLANLTKKLNADTTQDEIREIQKRVREWKVANTDKIQNYESVQTKFKATSDDIQKRLVKLYNEEIRVARNKKAVEERQKSNTAQAASAKSLHDLLVRQQEATTDEERRQLRTQVQTFIESYEDKEGNYRLFVDAAIQLNQDLAAAEVQSAQNRAAVEARQAANTEQAASAKALYDLIAAQDEATTSSQREELRTQVQAYITANADKGGNYRIFVDAAKQLNVELAQSEVETAQNQAAVEARESANAEQAESAKTLHDLLIAQNQALTAAEIQELVIQVQAYIEANGDKGGNYQLFVDTAKGLLKELSDEEIMLARNRAAVEAREKLNGEQADAAKQLHTMIIGFSEATTTAELEQLTTQNQGFITAFDNRGGAFETFVARAKELNGELKESLDFAEVSAKVHSTLDTLATDVVDVYFSRNEAVKTHNANLVELEEDHYKKIDAIREGESGKQEAFQQKLLRINEDYQTKRTDLEQRIGEARSQGRVDEAVKLEAQLAQLDAAHKTKQERLLADEATRQSKHQERLLGINEEYGDKRTEVENRLADAQKSVFSTLIDFYIEELKRFAVAKAAAFTAEQIGNLITGSSQFQSLFGGEGGGDATGGLGGLLSGLGGTVAAGGTATGGGAAATTGGGAVSTLGGAAVAASGPLLAIAGIATIIYKNYKLVAESNDRLYDKLSEMAKNDEELAAHLTKFERGDKITGLENFQDRFGGFGVPDFDDMPKLDLNFNFDNLYNSALAGPQLSDIPQLSPEEITAIFKDAGLIPDTPASDTPLIPTPPVDQLYSSTLPADVSYTGFTPDTILGETPILALSEETIEMLKPEPAVNLLEQSQSQPLRTTTADEVVQVKVMNESLMIEPKAGTTMPVTLGGEPVLIRSDGSAIPIIFQGSLHASLDIDAEALYISLQDAGVAAERDGL